MMQDILTALADEEELSAPDTLTGQIIEKIGQVAAPDKAASWLASKYKADELKQLCMELRLNKTGKKQDMAERITQEVQELWKVVVSRQGRLSSGGSADSAPEATPAAAAEMPVEVPAAAPEEPVEEPPKQSKRKRRSRPAEVEQLFSQTQLEAPPEEPEEQQPEDSQPSQEDYSQQQRHYEPDLYQTQPQYPSESTYQPPPEYNPEPAYQPPPEYNPEPAYQPPPEYQPESTYQPPLDYRSEPTYQPPQEYQPEPAYQPPPEYNPEPAYQQAPEYQPEPTYQPASDNQLEPAYQSPQGYQPQPTYQSPEYQPEHTYEQDQHNETQDEQPWLSEGLVRSTEADLASEQGDACESEVVETQVRANKKEQALEKRQRRFVERRMKLVGYLAEEVAGTFGGFKDSYVSDMRNILQDASDGAREAYLSDKLEEASPAIISQRVPTVLGPTCEAPEFGSWHAEPVEDEMRMVGELGPARQAWCKWWDRVTGCGELVDLDDQSAVAVVSAALTTGANVSPRLKYLRQGEFVEYRRVVRGVSMTCRGVLVRGLKGWPLMCELDGDRALPA